MKHKKTICPCCKQAPKHINNNGNMAMYCHKCSKEKHRGYYAKKRGILYKPNKDKTKCTKCGVGLKGMYSVRAGRVLIVKNAITKGAWNILKRREALCIRCRDRLLPNALNAK